MILSRARPSGSISTVPGSDHHHHSTRSGSGGGRELPRLEDLVSRRDYTGALTLLEFEAAEAETQTHQQQSQESDTRQLWIAYCAFHLGDHRRAASIYESRRMHAQLACCYFYLGMYPEARQALDKVDRDPDDSVAPLVNRLKLHLAYKLAVASGDETQLKDYEEKLDGAVEDQLCLASVHYLRAHYQEAIDIYKKVLLDYRSNGKKNRVRKFSSPEEEDIEFHKNLFENRDYLALNVYVALCYYKLDYYDVAQETLQVYLQKYPDSPTAINLKACNHFRFYKSTAEMIEMKQLIDRMSSNNHFGNDLIQHNTVVFRNGEGALQILPNLVDVIPEARLNLVIYYLRQNETQEAYDLIKDLEPSVPQEYILKGIVNAVAGQERKSQEYIKIAQQYFQLVGTSASECDTIPGRQCMASFYFLYRQFKDVLVYLNSIKTYFPNVDSFNFNYAQAQVATAHYKEAEEAFLAIRNERYRADLIYISLLAYCYIMNKKGQLAWELYLKMEPSQESFNLLQLIANTCYVVGDFWHAAKAFDMLDRLDPSPEHWEGKRGACCGTFQYIVAEKLPKELLSEVIKILKNTSNSQSEQISKVMKKWGKDNRAVC